MARIKKLDQEALKRELKGIAGMYVAGGDVFENMVAAGYVLWLAKSQSKADVPDLCSFLKEAEPNRDLMNNLVRCLKEYWNEYRRLITVYDVEEIKKAVLSMVSCPMAYGGEVKQTPRSVLNLACQLLDIQNSDSVVDLGVGYGDFICEAFSKAPKAKYYGNDLSNAAFMVSTIITKLNGIEADIRHEDIFFSDILKKTPQFNKMFCFPPLGTRLANMPKVREYLKTSQTHVPEINSNVSGEWLFALKMLDHLKDDGRAVLAMTGGATFNQMDARLRCYLLEHDKIEAVIQLPRHVVEYSTLPIYLVVLGNNKTWKVRMIDASAIGTKGRRFTELSEVDIHRIMDVYQGGTHVPWCNDVDFRDIITRNDAIINPMQYTAAEIKLEHQIEFGKIIKGIKRGASITSSDLDKMVVTTAPTNFKYMALSDIKNGVINEKLQYINVTDSKYKTCDVKTGNLVLAKIGCPFKVAVADFPDCTTVIGSGNMFIIDLDTDQADPYYIKIFLESEQGADLLKRSATGTTMISLSIDALKKMPISLPPLEEQQKLVKRYLAKMDEITMLRQRLEKSLNDLSHIMDTDCEEVTEC